MDSTEPLLIVIPVYNEAGSIVQVLRRLREMIDADILIVDDCSGDGSAAAVAASGISLPHMLRHERNRGYGAALRTGFDFAIRYGYDLVLTFDADGQHDPADVPRLLAVRDRADIISGSRFHPESPRTGTPPTERLRANRHLAELVARYTGYEITDSACGLKVYYTTSLARLSISEPGYAMPYQVWGQAARLGLTVYELPVSMIYHPTKDAADHDVGSLDSTIEVCSALLLQALSQPAATKRTTRTYLEWIKTRLSPGPHYTRVSGASQEAKEEGT
ncbi:MAG: glycosyltransferase family 2 protein [Anaerolineae bacterium]|nr:glycosyltransferase family 2 protein [Anaerolineae bacterium]